MTPLQAIVLGIIQALTEFIPISSTAHLKAIPQMLGWTKPTVAFIAVIQWGTLVAAVIYFWADIVRLTRAFLLGIAVRRPLGTHDARLAWLIIAGTVPIVAAGLLLEKQIKKEFDTLYVIAWAAIVFALLLLAAELFTRWRARAGKSLEEIGWFEAMMVGVAQVFAIIPGASRSGVTITGGLFSGLSRETAARFSFLLGLPAIFGAGLHQLYKEREELLHSHESILNLLIATVVSGIVGYFSIAFLIGYLRRNTTLVFIVYRILLGVTLLVMLSRGILTP